MAAFSLRSAPTLGLAEEKAARRGQMGFLERWLFYASGTVLRNRLRRHLLLVYLLVLHGILLLVPVGGDSRASPAAIVAGSSGSAMAAAGGATMP